MAAATRFFSRKLNSTVRETTVRSIKMAYVEEIRQKRIGEPNGGDITVLPLQKLGRLVLLGPDVDTKLQMHLKKVREEEEQCHLELQWQLLVAFY